MAHGPATALRCLGVRCGTATAHGADAVSGLPLSVLDRSRDLVDAGVQRAPERFGPAGQAISRGLATVSGWVERVPLSRRGDEGRSTSR